MIKQDLIWKVLVLAVLDISRREPYVVFVSTLYQIAISCGGVFCFLERGIHCLRGPASELARRLAGGRIYHGVTAFFNLHFGWVLFQLHRPPIQAPDSRIHFSKHTGSRREGRKK